MYVFLADDDNTGDFCSKKKKSIFMLRISSYMSAWIWKFGSSKFSRPCKTLRSVLYAPTHPPTVVAAAALSNSRTFAYQSPSLWTTQWQRDLNVLLVTVKVSPDYQLCVAVDATLRDFQSVRLVSPLVPDPPRHKLRSQKATPPTVVARSLLCCIF